MAAKNKNANGKIIFPIIKILILLVFMVSFILNTLFFFHVRNENTVETVVDGDTFQLRSGRRVRLLGVDAPEYDRCGGKEAKDFLTGLILGKYVTLKEEIPEEFGRTMALVYSGKTLVNEEVMKNGWARPDYRKNSQREKLTEAYNTAKGGNRGVFVLCKSTESDNPDCVIKGNIDAATGNKFYHLPYCLHYNEVVIEKDRGEKYFCTEEEAVKEGFSKASGC